MTDRELIKEIEPIILSKAPEREFGVRVRQYIIAKRFRMIQLSYKDILVRSWSPAVRESRGLVICEDMKRGDVEIVARPFPKFFNVDENHETKLTELMKLKLVEATKKRDGTLIIAGYHSELGWLLFTRSLPHFLSTNEKRKVVELDISDVRRVRNGYIAHTLKLCNIFKVLADVEKEFSELPKYTPMFEAVDNTEPAYIDVEYGKPAYLSPEPAIKGITEALGTRGVWFITMRRKSDGYILRYSEAHKIFSKYIKCVEVVELKNLTTLLKMAGEGKYGEGLVLRFEHEDGTPLLAKAKNIACILQQLSYRGIVLAWISGKLDDLLPHITDPKYREFAELVQRVGSELLEVVQEYIDLLKRSDAVKRAIERNDPKYLLSVLRSLRLPPISSADITLKALRGEVTVEDVVTALLEKKKGAEKILENLKKALNRCR